MKNKLKLLFAVLSLTLLVASCEDENKLNIVNPTGSFKIVTPDSGDAVTLSEATPNNAAVTLSWTKADFTTPTIITYTIQLALQGTNFANSIDLGSTQNQGVSFQTAQFNLACLMQGAVPFVQTEMSLRVKATSGTVGAQPTYSNSVSYLVTAFGCLNQYAIGQGLTQSGWGWATPRTLLCDNGVLTMTAAFANGPSDTFRFFTTNGDYGSGRNYLYYSGLNYKIVSSLVNSNDGDKNFRNVGPAGTYRLKIDSNQKFITIAQGATSANSNWLVGAATPGGWSWAGNNETELGIVDTGIYECALKMNTNSTFRVFLGNNGGDSWGLGDRNFPWYVSNGYTIDTELTNSNDGDQNFLYTAAAGAGAVRLFKINSITKVISVD